MFATIITAVLLERLKRGLNQVLTLVLVLGSVICAFGQVEHDGLGWMGISLQVRPDSTRWGLEASYQYLTYQRASRFYLHFGSLYLLYRLGNTPVSLSAGFVLGQIEQMGTVHLVQGRLLWVLSTARLRPQIQFSTDRLWFATFDSQKPIGPYTRIRVQLSVLPRLTKNLQLILNSEPFIYHSEGWMKELRSEIGIRWLFSQHFAGEINYFTRWRGYSSIDIAWEHAAKFLISLRLDK